MDYKKEYKNLVAKIKIAHLNAQTDSTKNVLEDILSSLRESEDERIRKALIQFLTEIKDIAESGRNSWAVRKEDAEMCAGFLAYLEKQKPAAEWSEEDEGLISLTIAAVEDFYDKNNPIRSKIINRLKSLRPSWKPSEEQMVALKDAVAYYGPSWE